MREQKRHLTGDNEGLPVFTISMDTRMISLIEDYAAANEMSKSAVVQDAIMDFFGHSPKVDFEEPSPVSETSEEGKVQEVSPTSDKTKPISTPLLSLSVPKKKGVSLEESLRIRDTTGGI